MVLRCGNAAGGAQKAMGLAAASHLIFNVAVTETRLSASVSWSVKAKKDVICIY